MEATQDFTGPKLDYLGHPCGIAEAMLRFGEPVELARKEARIEPREIPRQIGKDLNKVCLRLERLHSALSAVRQLLPQNSDSDVAEAVLVLAEEYLLHAENDFFGLAGHVLVAIESTEVRGKAQ